MLNRYSNIMRSKAPYQSTNIYHLTASLITGFEDLTIFEKIQKARDIVFPFDYPTPENINKDDFKDYFETMFISHYIDDYFKFETFERFQVALYSKMLEIMPTYNAMLSNFFNENKDKLLLNQTKTETKSKTETEDTSESTGNTQNINSIFPANLKKAGKSINNVEYATNGAISESENNNDRLSETNSESETVTTNGNIFEMSIKFDEHFKNIFTRLLREFNPLFSAIINV